MAAVATAVHHSWSTPGNILTHRLECHQCTYQASATLKHFAIVCCRPRRCLFSCSVFSLCRWHKLKNMYIIYGQRTLITLLISLFLSLSPNLLFCFFLESFKNTYYPEYILAGWTDFSWKWTHLIFQMKRKQLESNASCILITRFALQSIYLSFSVCGVFLFRMVSFSNANAKRYCNELSKGSIK